MKKFAMVLATALCLATAVQACDYGVGAGVYYRAPAVYQVPAVYAFPAPTYAAAPMPTFAPPAYNPCNCNNAAPPPAPNPGVPYEAPVNPTPSAAPPPPPVVYNAPQPTYVPQPAPAYTPPVGFAGGYSYGGVSTLSAELYYRPRPRVFSTSTVLASPVVYSRPRTFFPARAFAPPVRVFAPGVKVEVPGFALNVGRSFAVGGFAPALAAGGGTVVTQFRRGGVFPSIGRFLFGGRVTQVTDVNTGASFAVRGRAVR